MTEEILTVAEVAKLLKVAQKTVYSMSQREELPAFKVGGQWRFRRADLDRWISQRVAGTKAASPVTRDAPKARRRRPGARR